MLMICGCSGCCWSGDTSSSCFLLFSFSFPLFFVLPFESCPWAHCSARKWSQKPACFCFSFWSSSRNDQQQQQQRKWVVSVSVSLCRHLHSLCSFALPSLCFFYFFFFCFSFCFFFFATLASLSFFKRCCRRCYCCCCCLSALAWLFCSAHLTTERMQKEKKREPGKVDKVLLLLPLLTLIWCHTIHCCWLQMRVSPDHLPAFAFA